MCFNSDVAATAKRALKKGEMLDGEGGFLVWGKQTPADVSLAEGYLPLGLAHNVKLNREAIRVAERLRKRGSRAAGWIATDALRELRGDAVQRRLQRKHA